MEYRRGTLYYDSEIHIVAANIVLKTLSFIKSLVTSLPHTMEVRVARIHFFVLSTVINVLSISRLHDLLFCEGYRRVCSAATRVIFQLFMHLVVSVSPLECQQNQKTIRRREGRKIKESKYLPICRPIRESHLPSSLKRSCGTSELMQSSYKDLTGN